MIPLGREQEEEEEENGGDGEEEKVKVERRMDKVKGGNRKREGNGKQNGRCLGASVKTKGRKERREGQKKIKCGGWVYKGPPPIVLCMHTVQYAKANSDN